MHISKRTFDFILFLYLDIYLYDKNRDSRAYGIKVVYTKKNFGKHFPDYLGPRYFNKMI